MAKEEERSGGYGGLPPDPTSQEAATQWLRDTWGDYKPCPYCAGTEWGITPATEIVREESAALHHQVVCLKCGQTVFLHANFPPDL